ncbi:MAG: cupin domain-containing protein [Cellvibrionaceae bacterium]
MPDTFPALSPFWAELYQQSQRSEINEKALTAIQLNHDLTAFAHVNTAQANWLASPAAGVVRILLERNGGEQTTRATSLVAYKPNSEFSPHIHPKGEEFLVLAGTFSDEHGDYPAGTYVRNPPGSSHQPYSRDGCLIFVKLQQFSDTDNQHIVTPISDTAPSDNEGHWSQEILFDDYEKVSIYHGSDGVTLPFDLLNENVEVLILSGGLKTGEDTFDAGHWLRLPSKRNNNMSEMSAIGDARLLIKTVY